MRGTRLSVTTRAHNVRTPSPRHSHRPWTRLGAVAVGAHVFYELAAGAAVPYASRLGLMPAATLYAAGGAWAFRAAGRLPASRDCAFSVLNGAFLSAVIGHFATWPHTTVAGLPWLVECEGLTGRLMPAYNAILYASGFAAVGGLIENRRGCLWGVLVPTPLVPLFMYETVREYARLQAQARRRPRWWNRRLQPRARLAV
jgi:hypothetical protein